MKRPRSSSVHLVFILCLFYSTELLSSSISTCDAIRTPPRESGVRYEGTIRNDDYRFSAQVPSHFTGWGAASGAPFHGFTIYLPNDTQTINEALSCIDFSIAIHVSLPEDEKQKPHPAKSAPRERTTKIKGNGWTGVETTTRGLRHGASFDNTDITFSIPRTTPVEGREPIHDTIDVGISFITPTQDRSRTESVFRDFLSHLTFW